MGSGGYGLEYAWGTGSTSPISSNDTEQSPRCVARTPDDYDGGGVVGNEEVVGMEVHHQWHPLAATTYGDARRCTCYRALVGEAKCSNVLGAPSSTASRFQVRC